MILCCAMANASLVSGGSPGLRGRSDECARSRSFGRMTQASNAVAVRLRASVLRRTPQVLVWRQLASVMEA